MTNLKAAMPFSAPKDAAPASRSATIIPWLGRNLTAGRVFAIGAAIYLLVCAVAFFIVRPTMQLYFADYWEHRAIVTEIMRAGANPFDPIYGEAATSRQYTPWSFALAALARVSGGRVDMAMAWGAMAVSALFVFGVYDFARIFYRHRWAPALLLAALTCAWGAPPLIWTGFYAFRSQLHGNYYPASLVFSLTFVAWAATLRLLRSQSLDAVSAAVLFAVVAISVITHPLNAVFLLAGAGALALFDAGVATARRAVVLAILGLGIAASGFWPYFDPLSLGGAGLVRGQATFNNFPFFYDPLFVTTLIWPALLALFGLPGFLRDPGMRMPLLALGFTAFAYVAGGIADISVSHRLLAYIALALQLLLVKGAIGLIDGRPVAMLDQLSSLNRRTLRVAAILLILAQTGFAVQQLFSPWANASGYPTYPVDADTRRVVATLPPGARILGWDSAALVMPSHGVKVAAFPRPMPLSPSDPARQADYARFFARGTPHCERLAIVRRWHVTHIAYLTIELDQRVQRELQAMGPATSPISPWRLIPVSQPNATNC